MALPHPTGATPPVSTFIASRKIDRSFSARARLAPASSVTLEKSLLNGYSPGKCFPMSAFPGYFSRPRLFPSHRLAIVCSLSHRFTHLVQRCVCVCVCVPTRKLCNSRIIYIRVFVHLSIFNVVWLYVKHLLKIANAKTRECQRLQHWSVCFWPFVGCERFCIKVKRFEIFLIEEPIDRSMRTSTLDAEWANSFFPPIIIIYFFFFFFLMKHQNARRKLILSILN